MKDLTCEDICDILDDYDIKYSSLYCKGNVSLDTQIILINPLYNQDVETLIHEFAHIWYEKYLEIHDLPEDEIEYKSQQKLKSVYNCLDDYLYERTESQLIKYE